MTKLQIENNSTLDAIDAIFSNRYNLDKFTKFLNLEAVEGLWWSGFKSEKPCWTFYKSGFLQDVKASIPIDKKTQILKTLTTIELPGGNASIIP